MATSVPTELRGVVRGRTIELEREPGLPDGQPVTVAIRAVVSGEEGIRRSAGAWADDADELDHFLEEMRQSRKRPQPGLTP